MGGAGKGDLSSFLAGGLTYIRRGLDLFVSWSGCDGSCLLWVMSTEISVDIAVDIAVDTRSIVDQYSVDSLSHYRPTIDRLSTDHRPTIDRLSTDCRPTIDRLSTAISTAMSTYISVDITHSKQERVAYKLASQEYLACHVTSRCQGLFPPHPLFEGKALGTRLTDTPF